MVTGLNHSKVGHVQMIEIRFTFIYIDVQMRRRDIYMVTGTVFILLGFFKLNVLRSTFSPLDPSSRYAVKRSTILDRNERLLTEKEGREETENIFRGIDVNDVITELKDILNDGMEKLVKMKDKVRDWFVVDSPTDVVGSGEIGSGRIRKIVLRDVAVFRLDLRISQNCGTFHRDIIPRRYDRPHGLSGGQTRSDVARKHEILHKKRRQQVRHTEGCILSPLQCSLRR